jgi:hypothetical protein
MSSEWSLEELKKSLLDSAADYDRIVESMKDDEFEKREKKKPSEE